MRPSCASVVQGGGGPCERRRAKHRSAVQNILPCEHRRSAVQTIALPCEHRRSAVHRGTSRPAAAAMAPEDRAAFLHVAAGLALCVAAVASGALDGAAVEVGYDRYAEPPVAWLPGPLAMPCNALVNLGYAAAGWRWLPRAGAGPRRYLQAVFAAMALAYCPVQWVRVWTQRPRAAALDQWVTLPFFAWATAWCDAAAAGCWRPRRALLLVAASLASYGLAPLHRRGFEAALAGHAAATAAAALRAQRRRGDAATARAAAGAAAAFAGFAGLKAADLALGRWPLFRRFSGHFWSKVCDVLQIHAAFLFLTGLRPPPPAAGPPRQ
ncbi:transmembrane protein 187 [Rhea pennata]|uniref:transmembrane protein 187 n=1 Tax=Rhea pennata TaxID=8795 RepID=UPI002E276D7B